MLQQRLQFGTTQRNFGHTHLADYRTGLLVIAACGASLAFASPVDYTINFTNTETSGLAPTAGSFVYDAGAADPFSDFTVTWDGYTFDLTAGANDPDALGPTPSCLAGLTGGAESFALLDGACSPAPSGYVTYWAELAGTLGFAITNNTLSNYFEVGGFNALTTDVTQDGSGSWTITPETTSAVPEPSALIPVALLCALLVRKRVPRFV
jgi:hypothetical protein